MSEVIEIEDVGEFNDLLDTLKTDQYLVVKFWADWCGPCKKFAPHFESAAHGASYMSDMLGRAAFVSVDVDKVPDVAVEYGVRGVPTTLLFVKDKNAIPLKERVAPKLLSEIRTHL